MILNMNVCERVVIVETKMQSRGPPFMCRHDAELMGRDSIFAKTN